MPGIELLDKNGKAKELSSTEKIGAIKIAIDYCDPKLVQLLLGARYCQLWQYWLVRAIFNYDMLSLSKMAKCELPLAIANEQLRYLADKEHIDVEELNSIQADKKIEYCRKIEEFYGNDRILEIKRSPEGVQLESATGGSLVESMAKQIAGGHLQGYQNNNEGCNVSDSIIAAVNANFSQECKSMIGGTIEECQQEVKDAKGVVSNLTNALREKVVELESREKNLSLKISTVKEGIIKKMQDNKFMDKDFVQSEYNKLLDYYFQSPKYAGKAATADEKENPLHKYIQSEEMTNEAKNSLRKSYMYYGFGDCIDYAAQEFRDATDPKRKEGYLNIVRILAVNGAHSESLIHTFDTEELKR
ncbi:uncharacterized protein TNCT_263491 [Trichonephila clavata]|uniref:Uncharacterized protein n=1 Tax=Trichonephila clavata TaxID=2740835 RepID=A0A8X6KUK4_TRICU|nr:uncharacterized protein TNCT_263491 [Trichonephila clavata]